MHDIVFFRISRASSCFLLAVVVSDVVLALAAVPADLPHSICRGRGSNLDLVALAEGAAVVVLGHGTTLQQDPRRVDVAVFARDE